MKPWPRLRTPRQGVASNELPASHLCGRSCHAVCHRRSGYRAGDAVTDTTNEDKEIERIARIAVMSGLLARAMRAEAERDRLRKALERAADTLSDASLLDAWADARAALKETGHD